MTHTKIINRLKRNGYEAYTVGGCVRDQVIGIVPEDYDITTNARPEEVIELFVDRNVKQVGKSFGVIIVDDIEVATFRKDVYVNDTELEVEFADSIYEDLARRDLTINALAFNDETNEVFGNENGISDIHNRIIRFVGRPYERIIEDPCRILRACRFLAKIDGTFTEDTLKALKKVVNASNLLDLVAPERIRLEVLKAMKIKKASIFFEALHEIGALKKIFPALDSCWNHTHGNHHIENVWDHCMLAGDSIWTVDPILKLAGYLHDCGKPAAYNTETGQFIEHEKFGRYIVQEELEALKFSTAEIHRIAGLVRWHMSAVQKLSAKGVRRFLKRLHSWRVDINDFFRIRIADRHANLKHANFTLSEYKSMINKVKNPAVQKLPFTASALALKGGEVITHFNLTPSPLIGEIVRHLLDYVIDNGSEFNESEILYNEVRRYLEEV